MRTLSKSRASSMAAAMSYLSKQFSIRSMPVQQSMHIKNFTGHQVLRNCLCSSQVPSLMLLVERYPDKTQKLSSSRWWMQSHFALALTVPLVPRRCTHSCRDWLKWHTATLLLSRMPVFQTQWARTMRHQKTLHWIVKNSAPTVLSIWSVDAVEQRLTILKLSGTLWKTFQEEMCLQGATYCTFLACRNSFLEIIFHSST